MTHSDQETSKTHSDDPTRWSVGQQSAALAAGQLSSAELVEAYLQRIARLDGMLHAYVEVYADDARAAAQAADQARRSGHGLGPLHGIPIAIKDLVEIQGRITQGGNALWSDRRSRLTASLCQRLLGQGMILLGKTHTVQFAYGSWGTNTRMGTPRNPWDMAHIRAPGGSSSGSGVAVAARLAPWAIGTDTGGSVRVPASWCGLSSLKPTAGRVSTHGVLPLSPTLDTPGPMAASAKDAAWLYRIIRGPDEADPRTLGLPANRADVEILQRGVAGLRIARMPDDERDGMAADVLAAYDRSLDELADLGAQIVAPDLPCRFGDVARLNGLIMSAESYAQYGDLVDDAALALDDDVRARVAEGRAISSRDYLRALQQRRQMIGELDALFASVDAICIPTTTTTAVLLQDIDQSKAPSGLTRFANFMDLPAAAMPNGFDALGLPTSMQLMCRRFDEATALRIACAYQRATRWHCHPPSL